MSELFLCPTTYDTVTTTLASGETRVTHNAPCGGTLRACHICGAVRYCGREGRCLDAGAPTHVVRQTFTIDDDDTYTGWTRGEHWNGWACPRFERDEAQRLVDAQNAASRGVPTAWFDEHDDAVVIRVDDNGEIDRYPAERLMTPEGERTVYPVGAWAWVWDAIEERGK